MVQSVQPKISYVGMSSLYLGIPGITYLEPYGPGYPGAVAEIFQSVPSGPVPHDTTRRYTAYVNLIKSEKPFERVPGGRRFPIEVLSQAEHGDEIILAARINYTGHERLVDLEARNGQVIYLVLY
ncbi:MAG: hypothetical protein AAB567_00190 [Patescibacteria group bacterium]